MKKFIALVLAVVGLSFVSVQAVAEEGTTIVSQSSEAADGLDLNAVGELFSETENLEAFERAINDPDEGINNLDLDGNGEVDFIRIVEQVEGDTHVIILQAALGEDDYQDVATIEVEKSGDEYNMQVHGDVVIYGANYYVAPTHVHVHTWPIIAWIYRPVYHPYRSVFHYRHHPHWWRPFHPVHRHVYRTRTLRFTGRKTFVVARTSRVKTVARVNYRPRASVRVTKRVGVKRTNVTTGRTTTVQKGVKKTTNNKTGKTTVKRGTKKTTVNANGKKTTVKKGKKVKKDKNGNKTVKKVKKKKVKKGN